MPHYADKPTKSYGCVRCQTRHYDDEPIFDAHVGFQSKHGFVYGVSDDEWEVVLERRWAESLVGCHCCDCGCLLTPETTLRRPSGSDDVFELVHIECALARVG